MGIWIELGVFLLVFVFAAWQFHDLKREKEKRLARQASEREKTGASQPVVSTTTDRKEEPHR